MCKKIFVIFSLCAVCGLLTILHAQTMTFPYFCGFEDPVENGKWEITTATANKWTFGQEQKNEGDNGMYIAYTSGSQTVVGTNNVPGYLTAYRVFDLPQTPPPSGPQDNEYEISFDWKNPGMGEGVLYVCWVPDDEDISDCLSGTVAEGLPTKLLAYMRDTVLLGAPLWQNLTFSVAATGKPYKLLFWFQSKTASMQSGSGKAFPAACIDNVQVGRKLTCIPPRNIQYWQIDASRGEFRWTGDLGPFQLKYKSTSDPMAEWIKAPGLFGLESLNPALQQYVYGIRPLQKGSYTVAVRQICDADTSIWTVNPNILVYYSDNNCFDFLNLHGPDVNCIYGSTDNPYLNTGVVDKGFASTYSRHTVHYAAEEYDARTAYKLRTTPPDGMPSVRVGNWNIGSEAEAITYKYHVNPDAPLLLMKYAVVLQDPSGHPVENMPAFNISITDQFGQSITGDMCGQPNIIAGQDTKDWEQGGMGPNDATIYFKDWTSTGLNLQNLAGQTLQITIQTKDCAQSGHFGYGYFTMDCMGAKITGVGCGDAMEGKIDAPDGFRYQWYPKDIVVKDGQYDQPLPEDEAEAAVQAWISQPNYADTARSFQVPMVDDKLSTGIFVCRIISKEAADCWFELEANLDPRDVYAGVSMDKGVEITDCQAYVNFTNTTYTKTRIRGDIGRAEAFEWDFGNGTVSYDEHPTAQFDPGTYHITMRASIAEGECDALWDTTIIVPEYGPSDSIRVVSACAQNNPQIEFEGNIYYKSDTVSFTYKDRHGCDSVMTLQLTVSDEVVEVLNDTITTEDADYPYDFLGQTLTQSGTYDGSKPGRNGDCDTLVTLHLQVYEVIHTDFLASNLPDICEGDRQVGIPFNVTGGTLHSYSLTFGQKGREAGFADLVEVPHPAGQTGGEIQLSIPEGVRPGAYPAHLVFDGDTTGVETFDFDLNVYYDASLLQQKWGDVVAIHNKDQKQNNGYEFTAYAWYEDGEELPGQTGPYLYMAPGNLKPGAEYRALLTRADDGETTFTCPITAVAGTRAVRVWPNRAPKGGEVQVDVPEDARVTVWDVMGNLRSERRITAGGCPVRMPAVPGTYIIKVEADGMEALSTRVMVTE